MVSEYLDELSVKPECMDMPETDNINVIVHGEAAVARIMGSLQDLEE